MCCRAPADTGCTVMVRTRYYDMTTCGHAGQRPGEPPRGGPFCTRRRALLLARVVKRAGVHNCAPRTGRGRGATGGTAKPSGSPTTRSRLRRTAAGRRKNTYDDDDTHRAELAVAATGHWLPRDTHARHANHVIPSGGQRFRSVSCSHSPRTQILFATCRGVGVHRTLCYGVR